MLLRKRKHGSQREYKPRQVEFYDNFSGQGGTKELILWDEVSKEYIILEFESEDEVRKLLSQAHIIFHNYYDSKI